MSKENIGRKDVMAIKGEDKGTRWNVPTRASVIDDALAGGGRSHGKGRR